VRISHPARAEDRRIVLIVGGGFAGLNAARSLANREGVQVVLVDQRNHHLFQPLLYQVATAGLNPADIAAPIRAQFDDAANVEVHLGRVDAIDLTRKLAIAGEGGSRVEMEYDYLLLACGAEHSYFGHPEWEAFAPGLKTLEQATEIRRRILSSFEAAENEFDRQRQRALLTFVVVGGGPTGVELAGAIADISRTVIVHDFRRIDPSSAAVVLLEAGPRILPAFPEDLSRRARRDLEDLGVDVRTGAKVEGIDADGVTIAGGGGTGQVGDAGPTRLAAHTVVWAAGVQARRLHITPQVPTDRAGRLRVESDLSIAGFPDAFVAGDMAAFEVAPGVQLPGVAPAAMQSGRHVAARILSRIESSRADRGRADRTDRARPFRYRDKGLMATIGKSRALVWSGNLKLTGYLAWLAWLFVHVFYLIGFKNRIAVMLQWMWSYLFSKRGARLITEPDWRSTLGSGDPARTRTTPAGLGQNDSGQRPGTGTPPGGSS
jgi:NADH dehydrogenase